MFDFLCGKSIDQIIHRVIYFYLENLHRLEIIESFISKTEYERVVKFNAQARGNEDILNMFVY
ncbi:hypothetical protein M2306_001595 [Myroides gitamensis]|nr:hypothetical protein [Myroides gitamensis]